MDQILYHKSRIDEQGKYMSNQILFDSEEHTQIIYTMLNLNIQHGSPTYVYNFF